MVATASPPAVVTIEVDDELNGNLYFAPLSRKLRGAFDLRRVQDACAMRIAKAWPDTIPGQRLSLDLASGKAAIVEPLHDPEQAVNRERIKKYGKEIPEPRLELGAVDVLTFVYWMQLAVECGHAKVVAGAFPQSLPPGKPRTSFLSQEHHDSQADLATAVGKMATAFEAQTAVLTALVEKLTGNKQ